MGARHLTGFGEATGGSILGLVVIGGLIIAVVEANALCGLQGETKKPLDSVSGALWSGFILAAIFYLLFLFLF